MNKLLLLLLFLLPVWGYSHEKTVLLCSMDNWPPYAGKDIPGQGYATQIVNEAFQLQGYKVQRRWLPWKRVIVEAKKGVKCNAASEMYFNKQRTEWALYSNPYGEVRMTLFARQSKNISYTTLRDLKPYTIGLVRGTSVSRAFDSAEYLEKVELNGAKQGLRMIYKGRLDLFVTAEMAMRAVINQEKARYSNFGDSLVVVEPELSVSRFHLGFSKTDESNKGRLEDFNIGLAKLYRSGRYQKILAEYGFD